MTAFYTGDILMEPIVVQPPFDLEDFDAVEIKFRDHEGFILPNPGFVAELGTGYVSFAWPDHSVFPYAGLYTLEATLTTQAGTRISLDPISLIAEDRGGWHTLESARFEWAGASDDDRILYELLTVAREQCEAYGPAQNNGLPLRYKTAQLMQARNLWNSLNADPNGQFGDGSFTVRPFPLDRVVKAILRPQRVVGLVG